MTASLSPEQKADEGAGRAPSGQALAATPSSPSVSPLTGFDPSRSALRARAAQQLRMAGIGIYPPIEAPTINFNHCDGPVLNRLGASMHWLTWRERFWVWLGKADAWTIEADCQRRAWREGRMPCLRCDYLPFGTPSHAPRCPHRDTDGSPKGGDGEAGSVRSTTAGAEGIAQAQPESTHD